VTVRYVVKPKAALDLDGQAGYISAQGNIEGGFRFLGAARETFELLDIHPNLGWHSRLKYGALKSLRVFRVKGHEYMLIFYRPISQGVEIERVVHGSRNLRPCSVAALNWRTEPLRVAVALV